MIHSKRKQTENGLSEWVTQTTHYNTQSHRFFSLNRYIFSDEMPSKCWHMLFQWTHHSITQLHTHTQNIQWICMVPTIVLLAWFNNYSFCFQHGNSWTRNAKMKPLNRIYIYICMRVTEICITIFTKKWKQRPKCVLKFRTFHGLCSETSIFD